MRTDEQFTLDEFGNPTGTAYDLGGADDDRLKGEKILFCVAYGNEDVLQCAQRLVVPAVATRNLAMDVVTPDIFKRKCKKPLFGNGDLGRYTQIWYLSDQQAYLSAEEITRIDEFNGSGGGVFIWADNEPYYADANALAMKLARTQFSGNQTADGILHPGEKLQRGVFIRHALTSGLNTLYEGITICTITPAPHLTILAQSHDGQNCMACFSHENRRVVLDTGFTKIAGAERFHRTPGTARYVRNIAFWLAARTRDSQYSLLTGPEKIATLSQGQVSEQFAYNVKEQGNTITLIVVWQDQSELAIEILAPSGQGRRASGSQSPLKLEVPGAEAGLWRCRIVAQHIRTAACKYVLTVVERSSGKTRPPAPTVEIGNPYVQSHPVDKPEYRLRLAAAPCELDMSKTPYRIRATLVLAVDGALSLRVQHGGEIRCQSPSVKGWKVLSSGGYSHSGRGRRVLRPNG